MNAHASAFPETDVQESPFSPAWFAGYDLHLLRRAPTERTFAHAVGSMVLLLACANGTMMCVAVAYMVQLPPSRVWWVGAAWAVIVACGIERLVLQLFATNRRLFLVIVPRVLIGLLLAVQFSEPLVLRLSQGEINDHLSKAKTAEAQTAIANAASFFEPKIHADEKEIAQINASMTSLSALAERYRFKSRCEFNTPSCSHTRKPGCATYCEHYAREAQKYGAQYAARKRETLPRLAALKTEVATLKTKQATQEKVRAAGVGENGGLLAREKALSGLKKEDPAVDRWVWFMRIFFAFLDLLPLSVKVLRVLTVESPYDEIVAAERQHDALDALATKESARVTRDGITEEARADIEVNRDLIWLNAERRMAEARDKAYTPAGEERHAGRRAEPVSALSLGEYNKQTKAHESDPVPVPPALRRGGFVGLALLGAVTATLVLSSLQRTPVTDLWLSLTAFGLALVLAVHTRGFQTATAWGLRATFATLLTGLLLPLLLISMNL